MYCYTRLCGETGYIAALLIANVKNDPVIFCKMTHLECQILKVYFLKNTIAITPLAGAWTFGLCHSNKTSRVQVPGPTFSDFLLPRTRKLSHEAVIHNAYRVEGDTRKKKLRTKMSFWVPSSRCTPEQRKVGSCWPCTRLFSDLTRSSLLSRLPALEWCWRRPSKSVGCGEPSQLSQGSAPAFSISPWVISVPQSLVWSYMKVNKLVWVKKRYIENVSPVRRCTSPTNTYFSVICMIIK